MRAAAVLLLLIMLCTACQRHDAGKEEKKPAMVDSQQTEAVAPQTTADNEKAREETQQPFIVDQEWLTRAQRFDPTGDATDLVLEFAQEHPSELLSIDKARYEEASPYLNILSVDLDEDATAEHLLFVGPDSANTMFYVIDQKGGQWRIVHEEQVWMHNEEPELHILNTPTRNKTFYRRVLNERGSGIWLFTDRFYRLINGTGYVVLEVVEESNLAIDASPLYQSAESSISTSGNDIVVKYSYEFSPSFTLSKDLGIVNSFD